ncbi:MAG: sensor histidine kinase [Bacteroidia bacterium]
MKKQSFFLLLYFTLIIGKAQTNSYPDSLLSVLKTSKEDSEKVKTLNELAWEYSSSDLKKARAYGKNSVDLATKLNFYKGRSSAYNTLGNVASDEGKNDEALGFYLLSLKDKETIKDKKGIATVNNNIGIIYRIKGEFKQALNYYNTALTIRQELNNKQGIADCYNNIANIYRDELRFDEAINYMEKSIEIKSELGDKRGIAFTYNNMATIYDDKSDFTLALQYNYKAAKFLEEIKDINSLITVYNNIAVINKKLRNYPDAIKYSKMALTIAEKVGNKSYAVNIYTNLGEIYLDIKNEKEAKANFEKGLSLATQTGEKDDEAQIYEGLGAYYENTNDFKRAELNYTHAIQLAEQMGKARDIARYSYDLATFYYKQKENTLAEKLLNKTIGICKKNGLKADLKKAYKTYADLYENNLNNPKKSIVYYKLYCKLNDSLFSENIAQKFAQQQTLYETEKKEAEIKFLKQQEKISSIQLEEEKLIVQKRNYLLIASILVILSLCFGGYFYFSRQKIKAIQKQEQAVRETEENERLRIAKDIHDDLGSGLSKIKFLSEVIATKAENNPEIQSSIKSISETSVNLVDNMRDLIWALNPENTTLDSLIARIREYSRDYLNDFSMDVSLDFPENIPNYKISKEAHRNIFFMVKECLQNIVKHAKATDVYIQVVVTAEQLQITITDNGIGLDNQNKEGNGLRNIKYRAKIINAKATFNSIQTQGLEIKIDVPIQNIKKT